jgi:DNA recombination protein RmuC
MVVHLPGGGAIPVDAKMPLSHYLKACEETDPVRREQHLRNHAAAVRGFVRDLSRKDYAAALDSEVDYTVMFVAGEPILAGAFENAPDLLLEAMRERILIATPVTLVALLRTVGVYWRQEQVSENAKQVWQAALDLYERTSIFQDHLSKLGKGLAAAIQGYNDAVGSFSSRILPQGRKLEELGVVQDTSKRLAEPPVIEKTTRELPSGG